MEVIEEVVEEAKDAPRTYGSPHTLEGHWSIVRSAIGLKGKFSGLICSTSSDKSIRIWLDPTKKEKLFHPELILRGHAASITTVVQLADDRICTGSEDGLVKIWDPTKNWTTGQCDKTMRGHTKAVNVIILLRDNKRLCSGSDDKTLLIWDLDLLRSTHILRGHDGPVLSITETRGGKIISASADNTLILWNEEPEKAALRVNIPSNASTRVRFGSPASRKVDVSPSRSRKPLSRSEKPGFHERPSSREGPILTAASLLINGSRKNPIIRVEDGFHIESTLLTRGHKAPVHSVIELTDGRACSASADHTIKLWDLVNYVCVKTLEGHWTSVNCVVQLRDGRLCSCSDDRTIKFWDADKFVKRNMSTPDDHCVGTISDAHREGIRGVVELENGQLCSWSEDTTLRIWS